MTESTGPVPDEPMIVKAMRRRDGGTLVAKPNTGPKTGTSFRSFLTEFDQHTAEVRRAALDAAEVTPELVDAFKIAWTAADARGEDGGRVQAGLREVFRLVRTSALADAPSALTRAEGAPNIGSHGHVWPCTLFYVGAWNGNRPSRACSRGEGWMPATASTDDEGGAS